MFYSIRDYFYRESFVLLFFLGNKQYFDSCYTFLLEMSSHHCKNADCWKRWRLTAKPLKLEISCKVKRCYWNANHVVVQLQYVPVKHCYCKWTDSVYKDGNVNTVVRSNFVFCLFLHPDMREGKGLTASAGIQWFSRLKRTMYSARCGF